VIYLENITKIYKLGDVEVIALDGITCHIETGKTEGPPYIKRFV
jgi:ABC-type lipoprotein export system ATPase subunit